MEEKKKILIADDNPHVHNLLIRALFSEEYVLIHAFDGQETVDCIEADKPDLIVLDIVMPLRDGRDICRDLKRNPETRDIKVLMLTGKVDQSDRIVGFEVGADAYETKPFSLSHIAFKIKSMLRETD
jgi:DNA-binding response OmpR family regulator